MMKYVVPIIILLGFASAWTPGVRAGDDSWQSKVGARTFPVKKEGFLVNDYKRENIDPLNWARFIQEAIDDCHANGGGIVYFNEGVYPSGSIFLKDNVHLRIDRGVTLQGIPSEDVYPEIDTRVAGIELEWPAALINVIGQSNVAISGEGTVDGEGKYFWDKFWRMFPAYDTSGLRWALDYDCKRPRLILISDSKDVTLKDLRLEEPGFWTVHILYSENITVTGLTIRNNINGHGPSSDGIDIDSSSFILVNNCDIDCNDDNFCLKAGKDADGLRVNRPTEYVLIHDCLARSGHGLLTFGSETSGSIRHVEAYNLEAKGTLYGIRMKSAKTRGGTVEDVYIHDIIMDDVFVPLRGTLNWFPKYSYSKLPEGMNDVPEHWKTMTSRVKKKEGIPTFRNFRISNISATRAGSAIEVTGLEESPISDFYIENSTIECKRPGFINHTEDWTFANVKIDPQSNEALTEENSEGINWVFD